MLDMTFEYRALPSEWRQSERWDLDGVAVQQNARGDA